MTDLCAAQPVTSVICDTGFTRLPETEDGDSGDGDDVGTGDPSDSANEENRQGENGDGGDPDTQDGDGQDEDAVTDVPPSHDPSGTGEAMDADARAGDDGNSGEAPVDVAAEEQVWDEAMH